MKSLAEALGIELQAGSEAPAITHLTGKAFAKAVLTSVEFKAYVVFGLTSKTIPPQILLKLMDYAWGKVPDRVELEDVTHKYDHLTKEQLHERAMYLAQMAEQLAENETQNSIH